MDKIRFMVVSGFLGAGKTTTMIALAEYMDRNIGKTAIIANDLGANLVDTSLTQTSGCTVAEIGNDCICYQMDNTVDQIRRLRDKEGATFVMSDIPGCGVGALDHVYRTLHDDNADEFTLSPFMVMVDPERLRMIMPEHADINLPEELVYLLKLQLEEADLIVLGPGSLYTSVIPNLLVSGIREAIHESDAVKVYVMNLMTQSGETAGYTAVDHVRALFDHGGEGLFDYTLVNNLPIPPEAQEEYLREGAVPITADEEALTALGVTVRYAPVALWQKALVRHDPAALAAALRDLYREASPTRIYG